MEMNKVIYQKKGPFISGLERGGKGDTEKGEGITFKLRDCYELEKRHEEKVDLIGGKSNGLRRPLWKRRLGSRETSCGAIKTKDQAPCGSSEKIGRKGGAIRRSGKLL